MSATIHGVEFSDQELELFAQQLSVTSSDVVTMLEQQPPANMAGLKRTIAQILANQPVATQPVEEEVQTYTPPVDTYQPPEHTAYVQPEEPRTPPRPESTYNRPNVVNNPGGNRFQEYGQRIQDVLFTALAKAKLAANNFGDRWLGGKNRSPVHTQFFSINPFKESFVNPVRNLIVGVLGYGWIQGVVQSSSSGIQSVLDKTNAFSVWASLSAVQIAAILLFLEFVSDLSAIAQKIKNNERSAAGQKAIRDMVQNTLYFFAIYEFNKPWQILMITLANIFIVEKFLEEKFFQDSFATHARTWRVRIEPYALALFSLILSTNKTLSDVSLANASRFTSQDLLEIPVAKAKEGDLDLDPEQITSIHEHPMKLPTGEYLYIVETAEKQTLLNDTGEKAFRVVSEYPISSPADFELMTLTYFKLKKYTPPANASEILETVGNMDAYNKTLIVKADRGVKKKKRK